MAFTHDDDNLYFMYRFSDRELARRLLARGVILWLNGDGKTKNKNERFGLRYGGSRQIADDFEAAGDGRPEPPDDRADRIREQLSGIRTEAGELTVIRMGTKEVGPEDSNEGSAAASAVDGESFCYELRIPIADIGGKVAEKAPAKQRKIAVGIQIGGMTEAERELVQSEMRQARDQMAAGRGSGGIGGMSGGGGLGGVGGAGGMTHRGGMGGPGYGGERPQGGPGLDPEIDWISVSMTPSP